MKIAIVSFGHIDTSITLSKYLSKEIDLDLYIVFSQQQKKESILNFQNTEVNNGLLNENLATSILGEKITNYTEGRFRVHFFIYGTFKMINPSTFLFSYRLARMLKARQYDLIHFNGNNFQQ